MVASLFIPVVFGGFAVVILVIAGAWLYTLVDALKRDDYDGENDKLLWTLVILFAGIIGSILYYFIVIRDGSVTPED